MLIYGSMLLAWAIPPTLRLDVKSVVFLNVVVALLLLKYIVFSGETLHVSGLEHDCISWVYNARRK